MYSPSLSTTGEQTPSGDTSVNIPDIPLDIIILIFKRFEQLGARKTLVYCSQVCRSWYPAARKALVSESVVVPKSVGTVYSWESNTWAEWHGQYLKLPMGASNIVRLLIDDGAFFDHAWLATALASLPRLRHLCICTEQLQNFTSESGALTPFEHQMDILQLRANPGFTLPNTPLALLQCFPRTKTIHINECRLRLSHDRPINCDISPSSIIFDGYSDLHHMHWLRVFSQPQVTRSLRHLRLAPHTFVMLCMAGCVELLTRAEILEIIELDFRRYVGTSYESQELITLKDFASSLSPTIHTLRVHLCPFPYPPFHVFRVWLALMKAMPSTLQNIEIRVGSGCFLDTAIENRSLADMKSLRDCLTRFSKLRALEVILDDRQITSEAVEDIARYRAHLEHSFPELVARGALRLTSEVRSKWLRTLFRP